MDASGPKTGSPRRGGREKISRRQKTKKILFANQSKWGKGRRGALPYLSKRQGKFTQSGGEPLASIFAKKKKKSAIAIGEEGGAVV